VRASVEDHITQQVRDDDMNDNTSGCRARQRRPGLAQTCILAYTQCMGTHGKPGFPDPTSQGQITYGPVDIHSPQYLSASKTCEHLLGSQPLTAAQKREHLSQALKFSECMRSHGY
jgi:hypothetical protein